MKKILFLITLVVAVSAVISSCNNEETYADKRDKEDAAIAQFIADSSITVISEEQFEKQGDSTSVEKNEYVLFETSGVYMQIVRKGCGEKIPESGNNNKLTVLTRFWEYNLLSTDTVTNRNSPYDEHMFVYNSYGTFTGVFNNTAEQISVMYNTYGSTAVPAAWLIPLRYVNIGRQSEESNSDNAYYTEIARVKLIVPSAQGQSYASSNVQPCYYDLTFEGER